MIQGGWPVQFTQPVTDLIRRRYSCRTYLAQPIAQDLRQRLADFCAATGSGPFGEPVRFAFAAATEQDRSALGGLGTYGFIKSPTGFILGAMGPGEKNLEDYGYLMECIILYATDLGLGTCWLGGSFTKSSFARKIGARRGETVPAVTSTGYIAGQTPDRIRQVAGSDRRLAWERLFFDAAFDRPLAQETAGDYAVPLEMVRLGPSASNKQPWRIVKGGATWHFYVQRTPGYPGTVATRLLRIADMQRLDMGIAMCHFDLTAKELGLAGRWEVRDPGLALPELTEYTVSWIE
jgi:nitroreductase